MGSTAAYSIVAMDIVEQVALIDINEGLVISQVMDLQHSTPFWGQTTIKKGGDADLEDSDIAVIACGIGQHPGQTRLELVKKNAAIIRGLIPKIFKKNPDIIVVVVTNPVDLLTHLAIELQPHHANHIFGTGTVLDSARLRQLIGATLVLDPKSIHAYIVGEHGDSELPLWSCATIGGAPVSAFRQLTAAKKKDLFETAKNAAYAIIEGKQATNFAIAAGVTQVVRTILDNKKTVLPVSHRMNGEFGIRDICLSLPRIVGRNGILGTIPLSITTAEKNQLRSSSATLKKIWKAL